jgi:hypothetical protein
VRLQRNPRQHRNPSLRQKASQNPILAILKREKKAKAV